MKPRRILIIGASSTLGGAASECLQRDGAELWLTYRSESKLGELAARFPKSHLSRVDLLSPTSVDEFLTAVSGWPGLDGVVIASGVGRLLPFSQEQPIEPLWQINVHGPAAILRRLYPMLVAGEDPSVVFISSVMGQVGARGMSHYSASKAALASLARSLALEWAPKRIRVNAVAPGVVPSPLVRDMFSTLTVEQVERIEASYPLGFGRPEDVAHAIRFLLSREARWITGVLLPVDGGYTAQ